MNPHLTNKGSNPSPGAHHEDISVCFKTDGCGREPKVVKVGARRRPMNTAATYLQPIFMKSSKQ